MRSSALISRERLRFRLLVVMTVVVVLSVSSMFLVVVSTFSAALTPELENRTRLIGANVRADLQRIIQMGIPLGAAGGIEGFLEDAVAPFPEVRRAAVFGSNGVLVAEISRDSLVAAEKGRNLFSIIAARPAQFSFPIIAGNREVGRVEIESSAQFVRTRLYSIFLDVGVLSFTVILIGLEVMIATMATGIWKPYARLIHLLREQSQGRFGLTAQASGPVQFAQTIRRLNDQVRDIAHRLPKRRDLVGRLRLADVEDMRLVLLVYVIGAEITASFLPLYGASVARSPWMSAEFAAALPVAAFLLGVLTLSPFAGGLAQRFGARKLFIIAALLTAVALVGMALATTILTVAAARGAVAVLYAVATISCQQYALQSEARMRAAHAAAGANASSAYYAMIFGGMLSGTALGGIVSSLSSHQSAIFLGAGMVLLSAVIAWFFMKRASDMPMARRDSSGIETGRRVSSRFQLTILIGAIGAPVAATTAIFVWYLTPILLSGSGSNAAEIGRVVMLYYLMLVVVGPAASSIFQRERGATPSIITGLMITSMTLFLHDTSTNLVGYAISMIGLGVGHALIRTPLLALVIKTAGSATGPVNALRGSERLGGLIGLSMGGFFLFGGIESLALSALAWLSLTGVVLLVIVDRMKLSKPNAGEDSG